ncbi:hypothetical protein CGLO_12775 [Colletotrichum gloeosporioides Cg-14]|uniref:Uncharacterized protein n=1 Tax=Colletotrichum gloeosporioides (strain Cg-14) TaxID=1237896 RepID=T0K4Z1_COLGC|nr:hypothetical protein CGLO_12775 [Colletotrichum gloeosporioides Cg-14]
MNKSITSSTTSAGRAKSRSILLTTTIAFISIHNEEYTIYHFHDTLNFTTEIGVSWCI